MNHNQKSNAANECELIHLNAGDNWRKYHKKRMSIVNIYNVSSEHHKEEAEVNPANLSDKTLLHYFGFKNIEGGILVEQLVGNETFALITFAGVGENDRGKGFCGRLVVQATEVLRGTGVALVGVQMNMFDDKRFWWKQGFTETVSMGNGIVLILPE